MKEEDPEDFPDDSNGVIQIQKPAEEEEEFEDEIINYSPLDEIEQKNEEIKILPKPHPKRNPEDEKLIRETANMKCTRCSAKFHSFVHATNHYRTIHQQEGFIECCGIKFKRRVFLVLHVKTHFKSAFSCDKCDKSFKSEVALNGHLLKHEENEKELVRFLTVF